MSINFTNRPPYCNIVSSTVDGNAVVFIPAFYYKVVTPTTGTYTGKKIWFVSDSPKEGFTLHPAFMHNNVAQAGFYISAYEAWQNGSKAGSAAGKTLWVSINLANAKSACTANGSLWHLQNIYERHAIALLMLTELGTSDVQSAIGAGNSSSQAAVTTGSSNAVWRGIHEFWGNVHEWFDGFYTTSGNIHVFDNTGTGTYVTLSKSMNVSGNGFAKVLEDKASNYDLNSLFIPSDTSTTTQFPDYAYVNTSGEYYPIASGTWGDGALCGAFYFGCSSAASYSISYIGFRAARYLS
jgi:hypothetical protein